MRNASPSPTTASPLAPRAGGLFVLVCLTVTQVGCPSPRAPRAPATAAELPTALALGTGAATEAATLWAGSLAGQTAVGLVGPDAAERWRHLLPGEVRLTAAALGDGLAVVGGMATTAFRVGAAEVDLQGSPGAFLAALDRGTGEPRTIVPIVASEYALVRSVASGPRGLLIVAGSFRGTISAGDRTLTAHGDTDGFVLAIGADGVVKWATRLGGEGADLIAATVALDDGDVAIGGSFMFAATLGTTPMRPLVERTIRADGFVALLDHLGTPRWVRVLGGAGNDAVSCLAVRGDELIVGGVIGELAPLAGVVRITQDQDGFVLGMGLREGRERWAVLAGGPGDQSVETIAVGASELAIAGTSRGASMELGGYRVKGAALLDTLVGFIGHDGVVKRAEAVATAANDLPSFLAPSPSGFVLYGVTGAAGQPATTYRRLLPR